MKHLSAVRDATSWALRRTIQPYTLPPILFLVIFAFSVPYTLKSHDFGALWAFLIFAAPFSSIVYSGTRYRVYWHDGEIIGKSSDGYTRTIHTDEITRVERETSDIRTAASLRRPFRRIAIYAEHGHAVKWIDVSLKHFRIDDIRKLLSEIHERRPDLRLPQV